MDDEAVDIFNALSLPQDAAPFIYLEKRKPQGTKHLFGLLHAIKNKLQIRFTYQKFWEDKPSQRLVEPYALKEFKNRWYFIAKDNNGGKVKSFALDRLSGLDITRMSFQSPIHYNIEKITVIVSVSSIPMTKCRKMLFCRLIRSKVIH